MNVNKYILNIKHEETLMKNATLMFSMSLVSAVFSFSSTIIFSRFLGPSGYGVFKTAISLASTAAYVLDMGVRFLFPRYIAEFEDKNQPGNIARLIEKTLLIKAIFAIVILISTWFFSQTISQIFFHSHDFDTLVWLTMIVFVIIFLDVTIPILIGYQNFKLVALASILVPVTHIIIGIPLVYILGINGLLLAAALAFIIGSIPGIRFIIKKAKRKVRLKGFSFKSAVINYSLPAYFSSIPSYIFIVIIPILSLFYTQKQVGYYSFSLSFFTAAQLIPITLANVMFPKVAQLNAANKTSEAYKTFKRLIVIYTPIAICGIIFSIPIIKPVVSLLAPVFLPASNIIIYQVIASFIMGYFFIAVHYVTAINKLKMATALNWILSISFGTLAYYLTSLTK